MHTFSFWIPTVPFKIHSRATDPDAFTFQQPALQGSVRFGHQEPAACADDTMPWNSLSRGAGSHGVAHGSRAAAQSQGLREMSISCNAPPRNLFHQAINRIPRHWLAAPQFPFTRVIEISKFCARKLWDSRSGLGIGSRNIRRAPRIFPHRAIWFCANQLTHLCALLRPVDLPECTFLN